MLLTFLLTFDCFYYCDNYIEADTLEYFLFCDKKFLHNGKFLWNFIYSASSNNINNNI